MKNDNSLLNNRSEKEHPVSPSGKSAFFLFLIILFGAVIRLLWLENYSLHYDEAREFGLSLGAFSDVIEAVRNNSSNPPMLQILIKAISFFGGSDFVARLVPALSNIVSIFLVYLFTKILFREELPALFSSLFFALSFTQFRYSNELRPYSLSVLFACFILIAFELAFQKGSGKKWKYIFAAVSSAGFCAQYGLSILVAGLNIIFIASVIFTERKKELKDWILSQLITGGVCVGCFFWIIRYQLHLRKYFSNFYLAPYFPDTKNILSLPLFFVKQCYGLVRYFLLGLGGLQSSVMLVVFILGIFSLYSQRKFRLFGYIIAPFLITLLFSCTGFYPFGPTRQCLFLSIPVYVVAGAGAAYLFKRKFKITLLLVTIFLSFSFALSAYIYSDTFSKRFKGRTSSYFSTQMKKYKFYRTENIKPAIDYLKANYKDDEMIYVFRFAQPGFLRYYGLLEDREVWNMFYRDKGWHRVSEVFINKGLPVRFGVTSGKTDVILKDFDKAFGNKNKCWFVFDKFYDFGRQMLVKLQEKYVLVKKYQSPNAISVVCVFKKKENIGQQG